MRMRMFLIDDILISGRYNFSIEDFSDIRVRMVYYKGLWFNDIIVLDWSQSLTWTYLISEWNIIDFNDNLFNKLWFNY